MPRTKTTPSRLAFAPPNFALPKNHEDIIVSDHSSEGEEVDYDEAGGRGMRRVRNTPGADALTDDEEDERNLALSKLTKKRRRAQSKTVEASAVVSLDRDSDQAMYLGGGDDDDISQTGKKSAPADLSLLYLGFLRTVNEAGQLQHSENSGVGLGVYCSRRSLFLSPRPSSAAAGTMHRSTPSHKVASVELGLALLPALRTMCLEGVLALRVTASSSSSSSSSSLVVHVFVRKAAIEASEAEGQRLDLPVSLAAVLLRSSPAPPMWLQHSAGADADAPLASLEPFDAQAFLAAATKNSSAMLWEYSQARKGDHPAGGGGSQAVLERRLHSLGLRTVLRPYQLAGVAFMWDRLRGCEASPEARGQFADALVHGWFPLPRDPFRASGSSGGEVGLWFNVLTYQLALADAWGPVRKLEGEGASSEGGKPLLLADEMGLGKSLQVLCLALLLKEERGTEMAAGRSLGNAEVRAEGDAVEGEGGASLAADAIATHTPQWGALAPEECDPRHMSCACGRQSVLSRDVAALQCSGCRRWCHAGCYGFAQYAAAESAASSGFTCLACDCLAASRSRGLRGGVLLCVPASLLAQWENEMQKHLDGLKLVVYSGCDAAHLKRRGVSLSSARPSHLAAADIVLMSLTTLQKEFHQANIFPEGSDGSSERRTFRTRTSVESSVQAFADENDGSEAASRSSTAQVYHPPPFLFTNFSLVVVDETQKIESAGESRALSMAHRLRARMRLSLSGTPLAHGQQDDLRSLLKFLCVKPFDGADSLSLWRRAFGAAKAGTGANNAYSGLCLSASARTQWLEALLLPHTLRRTRRSVEAAGELQLPPLSTVTRRLQLSAFEERLYREREAPLLTSIHVRASSATASSSSSASSSSASAVAGVVAAGSAGALGEADASTALDTRAALDVLRRGCCHPQVFDKSLTSRLGGQSGSAGPRNFQVVMLLKVEQARLACEEQQRALLMCLFSMAGVSLLMAQAHEPGEDENGEEEEALLRAARCYRIAHRSLSANRAAADLFGVLRLGGATLCIPGGEPVVGCTGSLQLHWTPQFAAAVYKALPRGDGTPKVVASTQVLQAEPVAELQFHVGHRFLALEFGQDHEPSPALLAEVAAAAAAGVGNVTLLVLVPARVELLAAVGANDTFCSVVKADLRAALPCGGSSAPSASDPAVEPLLVQVPESSFRAKGWRLRVSSLHGKALLFTQGEDGAWQRSFCALADCPPAARLSLSLTVKISEAAVDLDYAQELHLCVNLQCALDSLSPHLVSTLGKDGIGTGMRGADREEETCSLQSLALSVSVSPLSPKSPGRNQPRAGVSSPNRQNAHADGGANVQTNLTPISARSPSVHRRVPLAPTALFADAEEGNERSSGAQTTSSNAEQEALLRRAETIEGGVLSSTQAAMASAAVNLQDVTAAVAQLEQEQRDAPLGRRWWAAVLESLQRGATGAGAAGSFLRDLETVVQGEGSGDAYSSLRYKVGSLAAVGAAMNEAHAALWAANSRAVKAMGRFLAGRRPSEAEQRESADCRRCKSYFQRRGPVCAHCHLRDMLMSYASHLRSFRANVTLLTSTGSDSIGKKKGGKKQSGRILGDLLADMEDMDAEGQEDSEDGPETAKFNQYQVPSAFSMLVQQVRRVSGFTLGGKDAAAAEVLLVEKLTKQHAAMLAVWARYQSLLNAHDELQMCKRRLSLVPVGVPKAEGEEDASLWPFELAPKYAEQYHKALVYSAELAKARGNLSFYRSQLAAVRAGVPADCPICMDAIMPGAGTPAEPWTEADAAVLLTGCGHGFHRACLRHWMRTKSACPLCKMRIHSLAELQTCNGPQAVVTSMPGSANGIGSNAAISGQWGTKIDALVGDLKALCSGRPLSLASSTDRDTSSDKIIVFSQWKPMLDIVAEALSHNRLSFVYCYEAAHFAPRGRLWCYQREAALRILLLPLAYGAEGLDLTEANHVVLLEPLLNSAMEQQALGRIDRLGQLRPTFVHRYVCAGTVEEKIHLLRERERVHAGSKGSHHSDSPVAGGARRGGKKQTGASDAADISVAQLQRLFSVAEAEEADEA